jgi:hypothetical protein
MAISPAEPKGNPVSGPSFGVHVIGNKTAQPMIWFQQAARIANGVSQRYRKTRLDC